jgi:hypothetical protein
MKASELRIGNWVYISNVGEVQVEGVDYGIMHNIHRYEEDSVVGIPLTEEWLEKFGFEKVTDKDNVYGRHFYRLNQVDIFWDLDDGGWLPFGFNVSNSVDFCYVHQLQNLYFALTGEELEIKE